MIQNTYTKTCTTQSHCWIQVFNSWVFLCLSQIVLCNFPSRETLGFGTKVIISLVNKLDCILSFSGLKFYIRLELPITWIYAGICFFKPSCFVGIVTVDPSCWRVIDLFRFLYLLESSLVKWGKLLQDFKKIRHKSTLSGIKNGHKYKSSENTFWKESQNNLTW